ncbi:MAG: OsmC family protein [Isosphaeraceae bacterium]|nr:OsmC family protein [Isosphaeraceae bacterium]
MNAEDLRALQAPLKARYRAEPDSARLTLHARGTIAPEGITCRVESAHSAAIEAGLHPSAGGDGSEACAGEMLLQALVACAGVTLRAVATALEIPIRGGTIRAEGDFDVSGTLGIRKDVPVGFSAVRLAFDLDADASDDRLADLLRLTERYCVVYRTLADPPRLSSTLARISGDA